MKLQHRFYSEGQCYFGTREYPLTEAHCNAWDWDQRKMIKIKGTARLFPPDEDIEIPLLAQFVDSLSPKVCAVTVDDDGFLTGVSTDPEEDDTPFVAYLPISMAPTLTDCHTIKYSEPRELDRLAPGVDLAWYKDESGNAHRIAFKFNLLDKPLRLRMAWDELNLLKSLPSHPNIVPFDRVVVEDVESRVIGLTTKYIPGGTLDKTNIPFRFEWLQQLTQLVDFLNFGIGDYASGYCTPQSTY